MKTRKSEGSAMTHGFQQQDTSLGFSMPRSAASPQHGQQPDTTKAKAPEARSFKPRPGH